jgi:hypothetical protein
MSTAAAELFAEMVEWLKLTGSTLAMCRLRHELLSMMEGMQSVCNFRLFSDKDTALKQRW